MLNIVIPMAGAGSRFAQVGYKDPKPLIPVHGMPMIRLVIENLRPKCAHRFIFICQRVHEAAYGLREKLTQWALGCEIMEIDGLTEGAACTVLKASALIDNDDPLMIANSDQYVDLDIDAYVTAAGKVDGLIMTMKAHDKKWSFVGFDGAGNVNRVVEKEVISDEATVGIYNFRRGRDFVAAANKMIARKQHVNGEYYIAPVYNVMLAKGAKLDVYNIGTVGDGMYGIGTPPDLEAFLAMPLSRTVTGRMT